MKESKIIEEFQVEKGRQDILEVLDAKFGPRVAREFAPLTAWETFLTGGLVVLEGGVIRFSSHRQNLAS